MILNSTYFKHVLKFTIAKPFINHHMSDSKLDCMLGTSFNPSVTGDKNILHYAHYIRHKLCANLLVVLIWLSLY